MVRRRRPPLLPAPLRRRHAETRFFDQFQDEVDQVKGIALGWVLGLVSDSVKDNLPQYASEIDRVRDSVTAKLGGQGEERVRHERLTARPGQDRKSTTMLHLQGASARTAVNDNRRPQRRGTGAGPITQGKRPRPQTLSLDRTETPTPRVILLRARPLLLGARDHVAFAIFFLVIALFAAFFGFAGVADYSFEGAKLLFVIFLVIAVLSFLGAAVRRRKT